MPSKRVESIDLLRGIVMVIMALDHARDYFHISAFSADPLDPATTTPVLYATRWITHLCAPNFVFLAGTSVWFQHQRKSTTLLSSFLLKRGIWLILLDLLVITLVTTGNIHYDTFVIQVLWAIGSSMVMLGLLLWLPFWAIFSIGLAIVLGHNLLDRFETTTPDQLSFFWHLAHKPGTFPITDTKSLYIFYPFLPWAGLMLLGYCFGRLFTQFEGIQRKRILFGLGAGMLALFVVLRITRLYGDPQPWIQQDSFAKTIMDFMDVSKYPPSLLYMCATVGPAILFLALVPEVRSRVSRFFLVFGRVPLFYYVLHFTVFCILNICLWLLRGHTLAEGMQGRPEAMPFKFIIPNEGYSLLTIYGIWAAVVLVVLYPLCRWYDRYKTAHPEKKWLSYL